MPAPSDQDFYDLELCAHHRHLRAAYGSNTDDEVSTSAAAPVWRLVTRLEPSSRRGYLTKISKHIPPVLGTLPVARLDVEALDNFYAELARCRDHCDGRPYVERHWTHEEHDCTGREGEPGRCVWHACRPLAASSIRQVHQILATALEQAVRWGGSRGTRPGRPGHLRYRRRSRTRQPRRRPAAYGAAAFEHDPGWGTFI